jgi:hypothetical protein
MVIVNKIEEVRNKQTEINIILETLTYNQVDVYIDNNVTDLASAKEFLKKLSKVVLCIKRSM